VVRATDERPDTAKVDILKTLSEKQKSIASVSGRLETTYEGKPPVADIVQYRKEGGCFRIVELSGATEEEYHIGRGVAKTKYYDGTNYWLELGNVVIRARTETPPDLDFPLLVIDPVMLSNANTVTTDLTSASYVVKLHIPNPGPLRSLARDLSDSMVIMLMLENGKHIEILKDEMKGLQKNMPEGSARLSFAMKSGMCIRREEYDDEGKLVWKSEYKDVELNSTFPSSSFRPNTQGKIVVDAPWPYDAKTWAIIVEEESHPKKVLSLLQVAKARNNIAGPTERMLNSYDSLWRKRNLTELQKAITDQLEQPARPWVVPALLGQAVYLSLVERDEHAATSALRDADKFVGKDPLPSYLAFKKALENVTKGISSHESKGERIQMLFGTYDDAFPLSAFILKVGQELDVSQKPGTTVVESPQVTAKIALFECRGNEVYYVDKDGLENLLGSAIANMARKGQASGSLQKILQEKTIGNTLYTIDPQADLLGKIALRPQPGVRGERLTDLDRPDSAFQQVLQQLEKQRDVIIFLVRPDSKEVFQKAFQVAENKGFKFESRVLGKDEPIVFPSQSGR